MNLGIEDAYVFAQCYRAGQLSRYHAARHSVVTATVARIYRQMDVMRGHGLAAKMLRLVGGAVVPRVFPHVAGRLAAATLGLDHEV
jgi:2-polyprenyl-6-methoxyphenol hydroxylase-like FAD-dependent oxidoreductase